MRELKQLDDLATRLIGLRLELGAVVFDEACRRARLAIARVVLDAAHERVGARQEPSAHQELTIISINDPK